MLDEPDVHRHFSGAFNVQHTERQ